MVIESDVVAGVLYLIGFVAWSILFTAGIAWYRNAAHQARLRKQYRDRQRERRLR
jgi:hypothetical protein